MIKGLLNWKLRAEIDRLEVFYWLIVFFTALAQISALRSMGIITILVSSLVWIALLRFLYLSFQRFYYTLWTLLALIALLHLFLFYPIEAHSLFGPRFFSVLAIINLGVFAYLMFTPVYYPIVSWWEYDFRFRDEVKAKVIRDEETIESRLSDLRRKAACLQSFAEFQVGDILKLNLPHDRSFDVEVMSKRRPSLGRPTIYGVRFILHAQNTREFDLFCHEWKVDKAVKGKIKRQL